MRTSRLIAVPGNHDRLGDDLREELMPGARVQTVAAGGLWIVRLDSTGPHNRRWLDGHGSTLQRQFRIFRSPRAPACWIPLGQPEALVPDLMPA